ncbi:MAG: 50S ribosomal protein L23 [Phycisphaerae bacterium]
MLILTNEEIIKKPLVSEKTTHLASKRNCFTFEVDRRADKTQIKKAIETLYSVKVVDVRTIRQAGKPRRTRSGYKTTPLVKKAIVKLHEDHKIDLF